MDFKYNFHPFIYITVIFLRFSLIPGKRPEEISVVLNDAYFTDKQDYIKVLNVPLKLTKSMVLVTEYKCHEESMVGLQIIVDTSTHIQKTIFRDNWNCIPEKKLKTHNTIVILPDYFVYRPDIFNPHSKLIENVKLRGWLHDMKIWPSYLSLDMEYEESRVRVSYNIATDPPYSRPPKPANGCAVWYYDVLSNRSVKRIPKCPAEAETVKILDYPAAINGQRYGIYYTFNHFNNRNLERKRLDAHNGHKMTVCIWLYILEYCSSTWFDLCSIMYHFKWNDIYLTPLLFLRPDGKLHVQIIQKNGQPFASLTTISLPLKEWCRIVFAFDSESWYLTVNYGENAKNQWSTEMQFDKGIAYDDVEGIFTFGGSENVPAFEGYIGQVTVYRNRIVPAKKISMPSPYHPMFELALSRRSRLCNNFINWIDAKIIEYRKLKKKLILKDTCSDYFTKLRRRIRASTWSEKQCRAYSGPVSVHYRLVKDNLWRRVVSRLEWQMLNSEKTGNILYDNITKIIEQKALGQMNNTVILLKQSACLGNKEAMYMLSVILSNGIHMKADEIQAHGYLMRASLGGHRLATLALAHKHNNGLDRVPFHRGIAYMYYKYVADKTRMDREAHKDQDVLTESIRLTDDKVLKEVTDEEGDIFMWLKHQAKQGVLSAQQHVGRALYWGAQGLRRNMDAAIEYFRMSAETEDPTAMYDYGVVLMRGQGTKKDISQGLHQIKKAAEKKNPQALNALGWFALENDKNYNLAADYFEQAYKMGNPDAGYHLGHMHFTGIYPQRKANADVAYNYFVWAASIGQVEAGLMVAYQNMRGTGNLPRQESIAVEWARFIAEKNPALGYMLRKGLHAYRDGNTELALFYYMMAAEAGVEVASFNVAWLCEENKNGFVNFIEKECQWRHYNLSTQREPQFVDAYALIKMGDYYWYGCGGKRDTDLATRHYLHAALKGSPHGLFNLAQIVEEGVPINKIYLDALAVGEEARKNNVTLLVELYTRCKESRQSEAFIPCALALLRIQWLDMWTQYHLWMKLSSLIGVTVVTTGTLYTYINSYRHTETISTV